MVRIRMKRMGRTNRAFWRICATDKRFARDGRVLEELGHYDPLLADQDKVKIHRDRIVDWLKRGAQPSDTVMQILAHLGLDTKGNEIPPRPWGKVRPPLTVVEKAAKKKKAEDAAAAAKDAAAAKAAAAAAKGGDRPKGEGKPKGEDKPKGEGKPKGEDKPKE